MRRLPVSRPTPLARSVQFVAALVASLLVLTGGFASAASAQTMASIGADLDITGYYIDSGVGATLADADFEAITVANNNGIGFVALDQESSDDASGQAIAQQIADGSSRYDMVVVYFSNRLSTYGPTSLSNAANDPETVRLFQNNDVAGGLTVLVNAINGDLGATTATTNAAPAPVDNAASTGDAAPATTATSDDSGGGFPWLWIILAGIATFFFVRWRTARAKAKKKLLADMEADRAEIDEQLKDSADQVISLGDRVIASKDQELIDLYEKASRTYQEVSQSVDEASTPEAIDALDNQIDQAEWELDAIEARLDGTRVPASPAEVAAREAMAPTSTTPPAPTGPTTPPAPRAPRGDSADRPALGRDESIFNGNGPSRTTNRGSTYQPRRQPGRSGGMGTSLLMMLATFLFNSYGQRSRRTEQRNMNDPSSSRRSSSGGGFNGGSVLGGAPRRRR